MNAGFSCRIGTRMMIAQNGGCVVRNNYFSW